MDKQQTQHYSRWHIHGEMCAYLAIEPSLSFDKFCKYIEESAPDKKLQSMFEHTVHSIEKDDFSFALMLPNDTQPIANRLGAIGDWCHGFLYALSARLRENIDVNELPEDAYEFIDDVQEIANIDSDVQTTSDKLEQNWFELCEYLRIGVLLFAARVRSIKLAN